MRYALLVLFAANCSTDPARPRHYFELYLSGACEISRSTESGQVYERVYRTLESGLPTRETVVRQDTGQVETKDYELDGYRLAHVWVTNSQGAVVRKDYFYDENRLSEVRDYALMAAGDLLIGGASYNWLADDEIVLLDLDGRKVQSAKQLTDTEGRYAGDQVFDDTGRLVSTSINHYKDDRITRRDITFSTDDETTVLNFDSYFYCD